MTSKPQENPVISTNEEPPTAPVAEKRYNKGNKPAGKKFKKGPKPPPTTTSTTTNGKRTEATFEKKSDSPVLSVYNLLPVFELQTAFLGILEISRAFYDILLAKDAKMTNLFSCDELTYTLSLCVYYRCATVANRSNTKIIFGLSYLKSMVEGLLLPDVLAQFVETFGQVKLSNGCIIAPLFDGYHHMRRQNGFVDPLTILRRMELEPTHEEWALHSRPVLRYAQACSRALKNAMELRNVNYAMLEGRPELLACYSFSDDGTYNVSAIDKIDQKQAQLGAAYRIRISNYLELDVGLAIQPSLGAPNINPAMFLTQHILNALRG